MGNRKARDEIEIRPVYKKEIAEPLTVDQANGVYDDAHQKRARADELEDELAQSTATRKAEIKELRGEADRLDASAHAKKRMVWRDVREVLRGSQVFVVRIDTEEVVDQRAALPSELQQDFPGLDRGAALPAPGADGGSSDDDQGDGGPEPTIQTPPGGAPRLDDDEHDNVGTGGPRSAAEARTRAPRKRGGASKVPEAKPGKGGKRGK